MLKFFFLGIIAVYRVTLSPFLGRNCRFYPSCSTYAQEAICKYGIWKGGRLTIFRLLRCHPWNPGGFDYPS